MKKLFSLFLFSCLLFRTADAGAATLNLGELADRLDRIEDALKGVQKKLSNNYIGAKQPSDSVASEDKLDAMVMQLQEVEQSLRQLTGEVETVKYSQESLQERIDRVNADMGIRFAEMEKKLQAFEQKNAQLEARVMQEENAKKEAERKQKEKEAADKKAAREREQKIKAQYGKKQPKELYDEAFASIKKQDYKQAQKQFEAFLSLYPQDTLAGNAQYWLGETFFARSQFQEAAIAFAEGFQKYRTSQKAPDNLFKLGLTMAKLKKKQEACIAFQNFSKEYPKVSESMKKRLQSEMQKLSCQ